jgi:hypothetical protein
MPRVNHLDGFYSDEIDQVLRAVSELVFLPNLLQRYLKTHVSGKYLGAVKVVKGSGSLIPCILGVDTIAVELYTCSAATF